MRQGSDKQRTRVSKSWPGWQGWQDQTGGKPESTGGLISLYIAIVAGIAVYYMFS